MSAAVCDNHSRSAPNQFTPGICIDKFVKLHLINLDRDGEDPSIAGSALQARYTRGGGTRYPGSGPGENSSSVMVPAGPLSETFCGEILSSRQSFSVSPSDSNNGLVPVTAKIAMRRSRSIAMPVSLTSGSRGSTALSSDACFGGRCTRLGACGAGAFISGGGRFGSTVKPRAGVEYPPP